MPSYSDSEMRAIMGRALQIDTGRSDRFTPEQLRAIAAELGISNQALEVAMYEADSAGRGLDLSPARRNFARNLAIAAGVLLAAAAVAFGSLRLAPRSQVAPTVKVTRATPAPSVQATTVEPEVHVKATTKKIR